MPLLGTFGSNSIKGLKQNPAGSSGGSSLYSFTTATFTTGGQTGRDGPSLTTARNGLQGPEVSSWRDNTAFFNTSSGIQLWTVPQNGTYRIRSVGATASNQNQTSRYVGRPADISGNFQLIAGDQLKILVGQPGWLGDGRPGWGGGGGTFVTLSNNTPLCIAGGGGAPHDGTENSSQNFRQDASLTTTGQSGRNDTSSPGGNGGTNGNGGSTASGGSAGGLNGNGNSGQGSVDGTSFVNGGRGGDRGGGFGGGGGCTNTWGGGGGGYSGGGGATGGHPYTGGGGASFISGSASNTSLVLRSDANGRNMLAGFVVITLI